MPKKIAIGLALTIVLIFSFEAGRRDTDDPFFDTPGEPDQYNLSVEEELARQYEDEESRLERAMPLIQFILLASLFTGTAYYLYNRGQNVR